MTKEVRELATPLQAGVKNLSYNSFMFTCLDNDNNKPVIM